MGVTPLNQKKVFAPSPRKGSNFLMSPESKYENPFIQITPQNRKKQRWNSIDDSSKHIQTLHSPPRKAYMQHNAETPAPEK